MAYCRKKDDILSQNYTHFLFPGQKMINWEGHEQLVELEDLDPLFQALALTAGRDEVEELTRTIKGN